MTSFRLSPRAKTDIFQIAEYTAKNWSDAQAKKYVQEIEERCNFLAANALLGKVVLPGKPNVRCMGQGSHVVFYQPEGSGIFVIRILHKSMLPAVERMTL